MQVYIASCSDDLIEDVAYFKASLQFSQQETSSHEEKIKLINTNVSSLQALANKHLQKAVYLSNQSRRNNLHFEGLMEDDGESLEETGENVKNFFVYKLNFESVPEIEHVHFTGCPRRQDGTPKPRVVVCKFIGYKAKDSILKTA